MLNNKKGQTGETITWIVATLVIIVLLSISIYAASLLAKTKITSYREESRIQDVVMEKSLFAYFSILSSDTKLRVYTSLVKMNEEGKFYGDFDERFKEIKEGIG